MFRKEDVRIVKKNIKNVSQMFTKLKDRTPVSLQSNVVYSLMCATCKRQYIGHTAQWLKSRVACHRSDINLGDLRCALTKHIIDNKHMVDWDGAEVLATESNKEKRLILEMCHIKKRKDAINRKSDTQQLSSIYTYLLDLSNKQIYDGPLD